MSNVMDAYWAAYEKEHGPAYTVRRDEIVDEIRAEIARWVKDGCPGFNLPMIPASLRDRMADDAKRRIEAGWSEGS